MSIRAVTGRVLRALLPFCGFSARLDRVTNLRITLLVRLILDDELRHLSDGLRC